MDELLKYIGELCSVAGPSDVLNTTDVPTINLHDRELIEYAFSLISFISNEIKINEIVRKMKRISQDLETTRSRNRLDRTINAKAIKEDLSAVWEGIERSLRKFQVSI